jgi:hypothetical protein
MLHENTPVSNTCIKKKMDQILELLVQAEAQYY